MTSPKLLKRTTSFREDVSEVMSLQAFEEPSIYTSAFVQHNPDSNDKSPISFQIRYRAFEKNGGIELG